MKFATFFAVAVHVCSVFGLYKLLLEFSCMIWNQEDAYILHNKTQFFKQNGVKSSMPSISEGSSVWCFGSTVSERLCKFKNLCYDSVKDEYIFFHGRETVFSGVPFDRFNPALLELSTVIDHNIHYFNFVDFPASFLSNIDRNISFLKGKTILFHRFMPDNIMHIIHDDLLPLYYTLKRFSFAFGDQVIDLNFNLVMMDGWKPGPHIQKYNLFTDKKLLLKEDLDRRNGMTCFEYVLVGLDKFSLWYQYGFKIPQGPLQNVKLQGHHITQFTTFVKKRIGVSESFSLQFEDLYVVLASRNHNRLILNEVELAVAIATKFNLRVVRVSMETHSFKEQISIISKAKGLIAMHGSVLIMSMFLPRSSFVIELFPYAITAKDYTPYQTLLNLPGVNIMYFSWQNNIENNTVTHPNDPPELGGIVHLSDKEQKAIKETQEIPKHLCCSNPYWLYRIYQDTIIDITSFLKVMQDSLKQTKHWKGFLNYQTNDLLYPSKVLNVTCHNLTLRVGLWLSWQPPWNGEIFDVESLNYEVWIQKKGEENYKAYILNNTEYVFNDFLVTNAWYNIWVRCIARGRTGPFGSVTECKTH